MLELAIAICTISMVIVSGFEGQSCQLRETDYGYVCVNNEHYCDTLDGPEPLKSLQYVLVTTSKSKDRFAYTTGSFDNKERCHRKKCATVEIDSDQTFQTIEGFGGAYTGSVTHLVKKLSPGMLKCFCKSYFCPVHGMGYEFLRIPIGGSDFDLSPWAYNEYPENDKSLSNFTTLDPRDAERNAQISQLMEISENNDIKLLGAAWGPPPWMKMQNKWSGGYDNQLKPEYYQTWADYHIKWLDLMAENGLSVWGISTGNEPVSAWQIPFQSLSWNASEQAKWIAENLGPAIENSNHKDIELHGFDENRDLAPNFINEMEQTNKKALAYLSAIEFHAYSDKAIPSTTLDEFQARFPDKKIWYTENCFGPAFMTQYTGPRPGTWGRAQKLTYIMIEDFTHSTVGFIDWNLILNYQGGPNYMDNYIDAPITLSEDFNEMHKQPIFYVMAHFSKFITPGSVRIQTHLSGKASKPIRTIAFLRPDGKITVILYNNSGKATIHVVIRDKQGSKVTIKIKPKSINTLVYMR